MAQKITSWLLIALVLSLGFGSLLRLDFYGLPLYFHDILVLSLLLLQGRTLKSMKSKLSFGLKLFLLGLLIGWLRALTLFPLNTLLIPSLYTLRLLAYLLLFLVFRNSKFVIHNSVFLLAGLVTLTIGLLQYFFLPDMRWAQYLGWDDHLNRLILPHYDPTFTGVMLGMFALMLPLSRWYLGLLVYSAILLTYSRSVWLSLLLTLALFIKNKYLLVVALTVALSVILVLPKGVGEGTNLIRTYSIESRVERDLSLVKELKWDLLTGVGLNTFKSDLNHAAGPNNSYLYLLTTTGVLGLVGWLLFLKDLYLRSPYKSVLVFVFFASLFNNVIFYPFVLLWILLSESVTVPSGS